MTEISIHALLAESDHRVKVYNKEFRAISIHALLAESDHETTPYRVVETQFLSTLSLRRATTNRRPIFFGQAISIHALLAESDPLNLTSISERL